MKNDAYYIKKRDNYRWSEKYIKSNNPLLFKTTFEINRLNRTLVRFIPSSSLVLDAGCGKGSIAALRSSWKIIGVDISPNLIQIATKKHPSSQFIVGDVTRLPLRACFDTVIFLNVLHHIPDVGTALKEAVRVLNINGALYVQEPNRYGYQLLFLGDKAPLKCIWGDLLDPNERPLNPERIFKFINKLGLETHYEGVNFIPFRLLSMLPAKIASILDNIDRKITHVFGSYSIGPSNFRIIAHKVKRDNNNAGEI